MEAANEELVEPPKKTFCLRYHRLTLGVNIYMVPSNTTFAL
jgi:hypothetical protein